MQQSTVEKKKTVIWRRNKTETADFTTYYEQPSVQYVTMGADAAIKPQRH